MATKGKSFGTKAYPADALNTSSLLRRVEPLITPEQLISKYLKGISGLDQYTEDDLKAEIELSINEIETESNLIIFKSQFKQRIAFDISLYKSFIFIKSNYRPILSVEELTVESSNGIVVYTLPNDWIELGNAHKGQINVLPLLTVFGTSSSVISTTSPTGAMLFLQSLTNYSYLPAFWSLTYSAGICSREGDVPLVINDIIGCNTAINVLSALSALNVNNSQSLGQDGISQSSSSPGPNLYNNRIEQLTLRKEKQLASVRRIYHSKFYLNNV